MVYSEKGGIRMGGMGHGETVRYTVQGEENGRLGSQQGHSALGWRAELGLISSSQKAEQQPRTFRSAVVV